MRAHFLPFVDRFVYGLFYPAILGTNIVLLIEAWNGALKGHLLEIGLPWALMLVLFVFDYVVTAPFDASSPPYGSIGLSVLDGITAALFLFIQIPFGLAAKSGTLDATAWSWAWIVFWMLHGSYVLWCLLSLLSSKQRFSGEPSQEKINKYKKLLWIIILEVVAQVMLIMIVLWIADLLAPPFDKHVQFIIAASIAIVGWFVRRFTTNAFEDKYKFWE